MTDETRDAAVSEPFRPIAHYDPDGNCVEVFLSRENFYGKQVAPTIVLYLGQDSGEIVGMLIENVVPTPPEPARDART